MSGAELLGAAAAAEQFAEVAFNTVKFIISVVEQIQNAPSRIQQEVGRLESLVSLATRIKTTKSLQTEDIEKILTRCESYIRDLQELLTKVSFEHKDPLRKKTWKAIYNLKEEENIMKLFAMLDHEHSTLIALISM